MLRKMRYVVVILLAGLLVLSIDILTEERTDQTTEEETTADARIEVRDVTYNEEGNSAGEDPVYDVSFYETSSEIEEKEPEKTSSSEAVSGSSAGETEEEVSYFGLRSYFRGKLMLDPEKVKLYLNIRKEPADDSEILAVLWPGDVLPYISELGHWYEVQCDGFTGFVSADYVLTDIDAYEASVDNVAYAVMASHDSTFLYAEPDDKGTVILAAAKSDAFRLVGVTGDYFEVSVVSEIYSTLYVHTNDVIVYYLFLGPGNDNELSDAYEAYFGTFEIADNMEKSEKIRQEAEEEVAEWQSADASSREARRASEEAYAASSRAAEAVARKRAEEEASKAASIAKESGQAQYLGRFMITAYCHCPACCGIWGSSDPNYAAHGASGMRLQDNYSVAVDTSRIPFGSRLLINGREYIAADTGVTGNVIDIYRQYHSDALSNGCYYAEVYLLP